MNDSNTNISFFKAEIARFVQERNWIGYHTVKNLIQALGIEVAELSEIFLFKDFPIDEIQKNENLITSISDEIADIFIYLVSLINVLNVDLTESFNMKMQKNKKKYSLKEFHDGSYNKK
jgi:dCTP diphosphatase